MPVVQIGVFPASDAFLADPVGSVTPAWKFYQKHAKGCSKNFYGVQVENPKIGYFVAGRFHSPQLWDSYEDHKALIDHPDYPELVQLLAPVLKGKMDVQHITFGKDAVAALSAPTTELATMKLSSGTSKDKIEVAFGQLLGQIDKVEATHPPATFGPSREDENTYALVVGWDSVEAHNNHAKSPEGQRLVADLGGQVEITHRQLVHVKFHLWRPEL